MFDHAIIPKLRGPIDEVREQCLNRYAKYSFKDLLDSTNPFQDVLLGSTHVLDTVAGTMRSKIARYFHQTLGEKTCEILEVIAIHHAWAGRFVWSWEKLKTDFPQVAVGHPVLILQTGHFIDVCIVKSRTNSMNQGQQDKNRAKAEGIAAAIRSTQPNRIVRTAVLCAYGGATQGYIPGWCGFDWMAQGQAAFTVLTADPTYYCDFIVEIDEKFLGNRINQTVDEVLVRLVNDFVLEYCDMGGKDPTPYVRSFIEHNGPIQWKVKWKSLTEDTMGNAGHTEDVRAMVQDGLLPAGTKPAVFPRATFDAPDSTLAMFRT
jgi:hypothetical protein